MVETESMLFPPVASREKTPNCEFFSELPQPLVGKHIDIRDLKTMPIEIDRLKRSTFWKKSTPTEFKAALSLWMAAWHEMPAASLPNDERILAEMAGVTLKKWRGARVHPMALYGFVLCSDNRFYHPVLAEKAVYLWNSRLKRSSVGKAAATKRWSSGEPSSEISHEISTDLALDISEEVGKNGARVSNENNELAMREALPEHCVGNALVKNGKNGKEDTETDISVGVLSKPTETYMANRASRDKSYDFEGKVIRLTTKDFQQWRKTFVNIPNLAAELIKRDAWLMDQPEAARKKWFQSTAAWLARVDRELNPTASAIDDLSETLQAGLKNDPDGTLTLMLLPIWKRSEKHPTPEDTLKFFRSMVDDATLLTYLKMSKKNSPAGMPQIKYVHLMVIQGTDPRDLRPWKNGYPPPAKSKPGETEAQVNNRSRAENRYEGLNV